VQRTVLAPVFNAIGGDDSDNPSQVFWDIALDGYCQVA